jgi:hypothetical protein
MENPVILQFDDDDNYFTVLEIIGYNMGFTVAACGQDIDSTRKIIAKIENKQLKPDIAIVSNYLGYNFEDGSKLVKKLREIAPNIKIIAYVTDAEVEWGDYIALKGSREQEKTLIAILEKLTGKTFVISNIKETEPEAKRLDK